NWAHLTSLTIDEFSLTPGTYDRDYDTYDPPIWKDLLANIRDIGTAAYSNLHTLKLDSLVSVGDYALLSSGKSCPSLVEASFKKLVSAGEGLLAYCPALAVVFLPLLEAIENGGYGLLEGCSSLEEVSLPKLTIGSKYLLYNCSSLTTISIGTGLNPSEKTLSTGDMFLYDCPALTTLIIGIPVTLLGSSAFGDTTVPGNITLWLCAAEMNNVSGNKWTTNISGTQTEITFKEIKQIVNT
ncbi:MAG: leucine-rich repeat domain-containing protein, partial [Holosporales bacterium]|nr:leucine-rich repeat domain-containing protein [Holosporales bacterium]